MSTNRKKSNWIAAGLISSVPALALVTLSPLGGSADATEGSSLGIPIEATAPAGTPNLAVDDLSDWQYTNKSKKSAKSKKSKKSPKSKKSKKSDKSKKSKKSDKSKKTSKGKK